MLTQRSLHRTATLPDGRVLIVGGQQGDTTGLITNRVEIFDPATNLFSAATPMNVPRGNPALATLADGRVLVVGGGNDLAGASSAEVYSPQTGTWTMTSPLTRPRNQAHALTLADGKVLVVGGMYNNPGTELFDPATMSFSPSGVLNVPRSELAAVLLADGRVLVAGGSEAGFLNSSSSAEVRDPATGTWRVVSPMHSRRSRASATLLQSGNVLIAGGNDRAELFDPATDAFAKTNSMVFVRDRHTADLLADGTVMVAGGSGAYFGMDVVEIYDPVSGAWRVSDHLAEANIYQASTVLNNGKVLFTGGLFGTGVKAELIDPACAAFNTSLSESGHVFDEAEGSASVTLTIPAGCVWNITSKPSWLTISSGLSGVGGGTITMSVAPNVGSAERSEVIRIANLDFRVSQAISPSCNAAATPTLTPGDLWTGIAGGSYTVAVGTGNCPWTYSGVPDWVTVTSAPDGDARNGTFTYVVAANEGLPRSGVITIAGKSLSIQQAGVTCSLANSAISSVRQTFTAAAGSAAVNVTAHPACAWTVGPLPSWMSAVSGGSGSGNGTFQYNVTANAGNYRSAKLSVAGHDYYVNQDKILPPTCVTKAMEIGVAVQGTLAPTDCIDGYRNYTDNYTFQAVAGKFVTIKLNTSAFDSQLHIRYPSGQIVSGPGNGQHLKNSSMPSSGAMRLPMTGTYIIEVTSAYYREVGNYSLIVAPYP